MKKDNKILVVLIFIFFLFSSYVYKEYEEWKGEKYVPNRFKNESVYESPTYTSNGLFYLDGFLWISSAHDHKLIKYDLNTGMIVKSVDVPCFEAAGLTFDGENFWIADYGKRSIYKISPEGIVLNKYTTPYSTPYGLAWNGKNIWILDVFGLEEYPDLYANAYPNSIIYEYDPENSRILDVIDSPVSFAGDIAYKNGEIAVTGCTSRKIFHVDTETKNTTSWYYSPDTLPRAIAVGEDNKYFVSGMTTRKIWEVNIDMKAQYKDIRKENKVIVPFWLIIITLLFLLPIFIDEMMKKEYTEKKSVFESLYSFIISSDLITFLSKLGAVAVLIYYISDYLLLRKITALITQIFLEVFGISTASLAVGNFVYLEGFIITKSCLSMLFLAVAVGVILATSINLKKKVLLSFLGFCIIFIWNILRLSILIVLTNDNMPHIFAHDFFYYLGGIFMIVVILKICSILSPEIKKDFSFISKLIKKRIISRYFNIT